MSIRRVGTWKDRLRRISDAAAASLLPGGWRLFPMLAQVDGYLFPHEAVFLRRLARRAPGVGAIVEIGSYRGRSTLCLAAGVHGERTTRIVSVDPHVYGSDRELNDNLRHFGFSDDVDVVVAPSLDAAGAWKGAVRAVFVDGNHEQVSVEADVSAWLPFLEPGGFLLLHDSTDLSRFQGPAVVARERLRVGSEFDLVGRLGGTTWARRSGASEPWDPRLRGAALFDAILRTAKRLRRATRSTAAC
jgi:MMP 1-O-methyltransferase